MKGTIRSRRGTYRRQHKDSIPRPHFKVSGFKIRGLSEDSILSFRRSVAENLPQGPVALNDFLVDYPDPPCDDSPHVESAGRDANQRTTILLEISK